MELDYNKDIELLNDMIALIFITDVKYNVINLSLKYKELVIKGNLSALDELNEILVNSSKKVLGSLSQKYIKKLTTFYFSNDGIILYIVALLRTKVIETIKLEYNNMFSVN